MHRIAISSGALLQFRVFGGAIGLAIASTVMSSHLDSSLLDTIGPEKLNQVLESTKIIETFAPNDQLEVLTAFASGYSLQMKITTALAGVQVLCCGLLWRWRGPQIRVVEAKEGKLKNEGMEREREKG